jgi:hypothetical protein
MGHWKGFWETGNECGAIQENTGMVSLCTVAHKVSSYSLPGAAAFRGGELCSLPGTVFFLQEGTSFSRHLCACRNVLFGFGIPAFCRFSKTV